MTDMTNAPKPMKWSGGEHVFTLNHPWVRNVLSIRGLPGDFGNTPSACYKRFAADLYSSDDIERVVYLSLVGGGLSLNDAESLIQRFVRTQPVLQNAVTAMLALQTYFADASDTLAEAA